MGRKRIIILGAGLAGLSAAWHLQRKHIDCQIFEKESEVGGLCRSKNVDGFTFDSDAHLLHFRHRYTFNLIKGLLGSNLCEHQRSAWIYTNDRYIRYPFQVNLYGLPLPVIKECLLGFIHASENKPHNCSDFLSWINQVFGKGIASHFMVPYNSKFWTFPPQELTCEWLDGFIPVPSLNQIMNGTLGESQRQFGYNARFWYPKKGGISQLSLAFSSQIKNIYTDSAVIGIDPHRKEIKLASGNKEKFDCLISTLPLPILPGLIKGFPWEILCLFKKLKWNSIFNLNLGVDKVDDSLRHWIYFPQEEVCFFRIGFPHNFSSSLVPKGKSSIYVEVSYSENRPIDKNKIILRILKDLKKIGILSPEDKILAEDINDIQYGYPIYDKNYRLARDRILKYLLGKNIISYGRYGSWRYMSMEDVIWEGKRIQEFVTC